MTTTKKLCKDCYPDGHGVNSSMVPSKPRPAPHPGPRCATHHREEKARKKRAAWSNHIFKTYGLTAEQYDELYDHQGGVCYICQRATGQRKRLAVDHDHGTGFVRGLLCGPCNKVLGHFRDDDQAFARGAFYLRQPPAYRWIGKVKPSA